MNDCLMFSRGYITTYSRLSVMFKIKQYKEMCVGFVNARAIIRSISDNDTTLVCLKTVYL